MNSGNDEDLHAMAERFAAAMREQSGEDLDFSPESLRSFDGLLAEWLDLAEVYRGDRAEDVMPTALPVAAYAGEVLIRALAERGVPARWITEEQSGEMAPPHLLVGASMRVNVVKKAIETLTGVDRPAFLAFYDAITSIATAEQGDAPD